jgi:nucleoside-diphosphate-sugar epimerase
VVFNRKPIVNGDESMPYGSSWLCHYAHTKAIAEEIALAANSETLRVVALRPHLIFGPGDPHLLPRVIESAVAGRLKIVGSGENRVDVSYVEDVAEAHLNALDALIAGKAAGQAYFISQGESVELWPWTNDLLVCLGHARIHKRLPLPVVYVVGGICELVWKLLGKSGEPPMTRFVAVELGKDHFFKIDAARRDLGYAPSVRMEEAVEKTVADLRSRGFGK